MNQTDQLVSFLVNATIAELKEKCKEFGCSTSGSKAEVAQQLKKLNPPEAWMQKKDETNITPRFVHEEVRFSNCIERLRRPKENYASSKKTQRTETELELVRRKLKIIKNFCGTNFRQKVNIRHVAKLIGIFHRNI
ncbi:hypothetical protein M0802_012945 [Mischocyttarus mexicanus]|nr:hypothetical protein M0802_012945 [Mischocyttarus mexicanus]